MANQWGYNQLFTDRAEVWITSSEVEISDGYGTPDFSNVPSGIVHSVTRNSTGNYTIALQQSWYALLDVHVASEIASGSPLFAFTQLVSDTVGSTSAGGPGQTKQGITFKFVNGSGTAVELPSGSSFRFTLFLKRSSA